MLGCSSRQGECVCIARVDAKCCTEGILKYNKEENKIGGSGIKLN